MLERCCLSHAVSMRPARTVSKGNPYKLNEICILMISSEGPDKSSLSNDVLIYRLPSYSEVELNIYIHCSGYVDLQPGTKQPK